jgi:hypothetical protein
LLFLLSLLITHFQFPQQNQKIYYYFFEYFSKSSATRNPSLIGCGYLVVLLKNNSIGLISFLPADNSLISSNLSLLFIDNSSLKVYIEFLSTGNIVEEVIG